MVINIVLQYKRIPNSVKKNLRKLIKLKTNSLCLFRIVEIRLYKKETFGLLKAQLVGSYLSSRTGLHLVFK